MALSLKKVEDFVTPKNGVVMADVAPLIDAEVALLNEAPDKMEEEDWPAKKDGVEEEEAVSMSVGESGQKRRDLVKEWKSGRWSKP